MFIVKNPEPEELLNTLVTEVPEDSQEILPNTCVSYSGGTLIYTLLPDGAVRSSEREAIFLAPTKLNQRLSGYADRLKSSDCQFGFKPSRPVFGHAAGACRLNIDHPGLYRILVSLGETIDNQFKTLAPDCWAQQDHTIRSSVRAEYLIGKTHFTQGVINRNNKLAYHFDRGNFKDTMSAMVYFLKGEVTGGELIIPSLGSFLRPVDGGLVLFLGQNLIHGVAKIKRRTVQAQRMSLVYYAIERMGKAESQEEELKKARAIQTKKIFQGKV